MSEKDESITQKWIELAETVARKYLSLEHEERLRFFDIDPDEELPDNGIPTTRYQAEDCRNDRLYWVEIITGPYEGTKCAAWRNDPGGRWNWVVDFAYDGLPLDYEDEGIRVIHEIIPED